METTYTIDWMQKKVTSTGKEKADASLKTENGQMVDKVTIWADYPGFAELMPGSKVSGTLSPAKDPRFGPTLYPPKAPKTASTDAFKTKLAQDTIDYKDKKIGARMDDKQFGIKVSSTFRAAVDSAIEEHSTQMRLSPSTTQPLTELFAKWREFYWGNFDVREDQYPPFN